MSTAAAGKIHILDNATTSHHSEAVADFHPPSTPYHIQDTADFQRKRTDRP